MLPGCYITEQIIMFSVVIEYARANRPASGMLA